MFYVQGVQKNRIESKFKGEIFHTETYDPRSDFDRNHLNIPTFISVDLYTLERNFWDVTEKMKTLF